MTDRGYCCCGSYFLTLVWFIVALLVGGGLAMYYTGFYIVVIDVADFFCRIFTSGDTCWPVPANGTEHGNVTLLSYLGNGTLLD
jgi:hypothetical protein